MFVNMTYDFLVINIIYVNLFYKIKQFDKLYTIVLKHKKKIFSYINIEKYFSIISAKIDVYFIKIVCMQFY